MLDGGAGDDTLIAGGGNDSLDGGAGDDSLVGGAGDDLYRVRSVSTILTEAAGGGADTVVAYVSFVLAAELETLVLIGTGNLTGTGNEQDNLIIGTIGANLLMGMGGADTLFGDLGADTLDGGTGADSLSGGAGNDWFIVDDAGDRVVDSAGADIVAASVSYTLGLGIEALILTGAAGLSGTGGAAAELLVGNTGNNNLSGLSGNDTLRGGDGADTLNGGAGDDRMFGGLGDDVYIVDSTADILNETGAGGFDLVRAAISFTLGNGFEALVLTGTALNGTGSEGGNTLTGNALGNILTGLGGVDWLSGGEGADTLIGGVGADTLDGGAGADSLVGGANDDVYLIRDLLETVVELAGGGNDEVRATVSVTLAAEVERLKLLGTAGLSGTGNASANRMDGNAGANLFVGLDGNDTLNGAGGADTLRGGEGNDVLNGQTGADLLEGGAGNDRLSGGGGGDTLIGGAGADRLSGAAGIADVFHWASAAEGQGDLVIGFEHNVDQLQFTSVGFGGLALGVLAAANFAANTTGWASSAAGTPQFIYETDTGRLWWDADGAGGAAAQVMMQFAARPVVTAADISVIA